MSQNSEVNSVEVLYFIREAQRLSEVIRDLELSIKSTVCPFYKHEIPIGAELFSI